MRFLAALILCATLTGAAARAEPLSIVTEEFPPYNYTRGGIAAGLSADVVQAVLDEIGQTAAFEFMPWVRAYLTAKNRKNTLIFSIARVPEREDFFKWIGVIAPYNTSFYKRIDREDITVTKLDDARRYTVGVSVEDVIYVYLKRQKFINLEVVGQDILNIRKLAFGRIDLVAFDEASFEHRLLEEEIDPKQFERLYRLEDISGSLYMAFNKDSDPGLVDAFRQGLEAIKDKGIYDEILQDYRLTY